MWCLLVFFFEGVVLFVLDGWCVVCEFVDCYIEYGC